MPQCTPLVPVSGLLSRTPKRKMGSPGWLTQHREHHLDFLQETQAFLSPQWSSTVGPETQIHHLGSHFTLGSVSFSFCALQGETLSQGQLEWEGRVSLLEALPLSVASK